MTTNPPDVARSAAETAANAAAVDPGGIVAALVARYGDAHRAAIAAGVARVAERWTAADGDEGALSAFCADRYVADPVDRARLLERFETLLALAAGHLYEIRRGLRRWMDLAGDELPALDDLAALFDPAPDLAEQWYAQKLAFVALLNFDRPDLPAMLAEGGGWTPARWAEARIGQAFGPRIPQALADDARRAHHAAQRFVDGFHVAVGGLVDADGRRPFAPDRRVIAHWLMREAIRGQYGAPGGDAAQRAMAHVMRHHVAGTVPRAVLAADGGARAWDPAAGTLDGRPVADVDTVGPERYAHILAHVAIARRLDAHHPSHPTALERSFALQREVPVAEVEAQLEGLLASPVRVDLAAFARARIGRPLEAHDVYFDQGRPAETGDALDARVAARWPTAADLEAALPAILRELGFDDADARFLGERVRVEIARGAGHAVRPGMPEYPAWLRTNGTGGALTWDGFQIAMHELGHNLEQLVSTHLVPRPALRGVPNTACTEAFAFLYEAQARRVLGVAGDADEAAAFDAAAIETALDACQIAGPALVELRAWRWLYDHPDATPAALRDEVLALSDAVWDAHYARFFGPDPYRLLGAYQHMVGYPLYLSNYALGHMIGHQVRSHVRGRDLAAETKRIFALGRLTPDAWLRAAVGSGLSSAPLLADAAAAVARAGDR